MNYELKKMTDFKQKLTALLKSRNVGDFGSCSNIPNKPTCVVYFGESSSACHESIFGRLANGWGNCVEQIPFYSLDANGLTTLNGEPVDRESFGNAMTQLLRTSSNAAFADPSGINLYCILDTDSVDSLQPESDFKEWYSAIDKLKSMLNTPSTTMLLIALNDEFNTLEKSIKIKQTLCGIYQSQNKVHSYESVFVVGRRLRNGAYAGNGENHGDLFANIILLSNTIDDGKNARQSCLYKPTVPALTVAFASSAKPVGDIAVITLKAIIAKLSGMLNDVNCSETAQERILKALEIDKGRCGFYERVFLEQISSQLPSNDCFDLLPRKTQKELDFSQSFEQIDNETFGGLSAFLQSNHFSVIAKEIETAKPGLAEQLCERFCANLKANHIGSGSGIGREVLSVIFGKIEIAPDLNSDYSTLDSVKAKLKSRVADSLKEIILETLDLLSAKAKTCMNGFERIQKAVSLLPAIRETGAGKDLVKFYAAQAERFLNIENSAKIFDEIFSLHNTESDIQDALFAAMESCFKSAAVYRHSYIDEMYERLSINDVNTATGQIMGELIESIDTKVRFYSETVFPNNRSLEAYFLNKSNKNHDSQNGLGLEQRLENRELPPNTGRTFFDTQNNESVESMWFYECRENDLGAG